VTHRISAGVLVEHDQRILLVRCLVPGVFDFWVAPGGGAKGTETLRETARREVREETGLDVEVRDLMYIEELYGGGVRHCKFWFAGWLLGGTLSVASPDAQAEHIVEAAWFDATAIKSRTVFPLALTGSYWTDRLVKPRVPIHFATPRPIEF
jgi:8-oxo-dGTP diphosphatase